jgi:hypothetical protein
MNINFDIDTYKTKFTGGARQYLFFAYFTFPYSIGNSVIPYLVKSTSIPDSSLEEIVVPYPGISFKMAGTRTYGDWQISFNVDEDGVLLHGFHNWHDLIYDSDTHSQISANNYMRNQTLFLLDGNGASTEQITLYGAWPKSVGAVGLDYATSDIATMDVTFSYQYYKFETLSSNILWSSVLNKLSESLLE